MRLVGSGIGHDRFKTRDHVQCHVVVAVVLQAQGAQLGIVLGADENRGFEVQIRRGGVKLDAVGQKGGLIVPVRVRCRVQRDRRDMRIPRRADV